ncbi:mitogen-activated protein kinase kinase kinase NPK1-like [Rutidosis leptorrhynchoides]|uniref:mitogen-activated protein kinase kinase kinase NPK1-like n=1 Tax=Rutidosis leptorrhynchoides TaxID=125765 RepID=UPI003A997D66
MTCQMDDNDLMADSSMKLDSSLLCDAPNKSFNPMMEPDDDWTCQFDASPEVVKSETNLFLDQVSEMASECAGAFGNADNGFTFPNGVSRVEEDEELTEIKIRAFLDEKVQFFSFLGFFSYKRTIWVAILTHMNGFKGLKLIHSLFMKALELKKMQTPLYEEFYYPLNAAISPVWNENKENSSNNLYLPPKSKSPSRFLKKRLSSAVDVSDIDSPVNNLRRGSHITCLSPQKENVVDRDTISPIFLVSLIVGFVVVYGFVEYTYRGRNMAA